MMTKLPQNRRGIATVEFAIVVPLLVAFFLGMCEVGLALNATLIVQSAAAGGGRLASIGQLTNAQVRQAVLTYLTVAGIPTTDAEVDVKDLTHSSSDVSEASALDKIQVTATVPFKDVRWGVSGFIVNDTSMVTGRATYYSARVNPYPTSISVPDGF